MKVKARIYINRSPTYPFFEIYIEDSGIYWKRIATKGTLEAAIQYCIDRGLDYEDCGG